MSELASAAGSSEPSKVTNDKIDTKSIKRKFPFNNRKVGNKRPRFTGEQHPVSYNQQSLPRTLMTLPIHTPFLIHTSTIGLHALAEQVHEVLIMRDRKLESTCTLEGLLYCATLATIYRFYSVGEAYGYHFGVPSDYSILKQLSSAIILPEPICKYIESIGRVDTNFGIAVAPFIPTLRNFLVHPDYMDLPAIHASASDKPNIFLNYRLVGDRHTPPQGMDLDNSFSCLLDGDVVSKFIAGTTRGYKANVNFRKCEFAVATGKPEFLVSYADSGSFRTGYAPYVMEEATVQTGASYGFRNETNRANWQGDKQCLPMNHQSGAYLLRPFVVSSIMSGNSAFTRH